MISVQRLEQRMVPRFCWFDLRLAESLYSMYGVPVSCCESRMANQSVCALIVLRAFPSASYLAYRSSNSFPHVSHSPGHSFGQKSDQSPPSSIRFMKRSGIHSA